MGVGERLHQQRCDAHGLYSHTLQEGCTVSRDLPTSEPTSALTERCLMTQEGGYSCVRLEHGV